ncbi:hypothetical protein TWF225_008752 [Orbilia oligospora]|nr:hypothetical protein TWF225_008752 [Orbilia oligospora]KAF3252333.1 hypothetical protein TWF128_006709 [Orbilia oligospora]KAF3252335.1 hypothetical protein TWF128_006709 [Orbilia oligospora]KAF3269349.1 hypothetical protein TWF217_009430 [Orbilia oligospora]
MKAASFALWSSLCFGATSARPASNACMQSSRTTDTTTYQASSMTFATYSGAPNGIPVGHENIATLLPGVFWDQDLSDVRNLAPDSKCKLFYAEHNDATRPGQIAEATYNMKYPTVALEHSRHVKSVRCPRPDHINITFRSKQAYQWAKKYWIPFNAKSNDTMVFVGKFKGCNPTKLGGMRSWSLVDDLTFNDITFTADAVIQYSDIKDVVKEATIRFGKYLPKSQSDLGDSPPAPTPIQQYEAPYYASATTEIAKPTEYQGQYLADYGKWGADFDTQKDDHIGYVDASKPIITPAPEIRGPNISKRWGWNPWGNITSAFKAVTSEVKQIIPVVSSVLSGGASAIEGGVKAISTDAADVLNDFTTYTKKFDLPSFKIKVDVDDDLTPWDNLRGKLLINNIADVTLYCVECGAEGTAHFSASITFSLTRGIQAGSIDFEGNIKARFSLGIVNNNRNINIPLAGDIKYELFNIGLPSLSIPNVLTIGPYIALDVVGTVSMGATGLIRAGFELEIEKPRFHADLKNLSRSTATGWVPKFRPIFSLDGNLTVNAELKTPLSLNFGINILKGKFETSLSVSEAPTVKLSLTNGFDGAINPKALENPRVGLINGTFTPTTGTCPGSVLGMRVGLDTVMQVKGLPFTFPLLRVDLYRNEWCIKHSLWTLFNTPTRRSTIDPPDPGYLVGHVDYPVGDLSLVSGTNGNIYVDSSTIPEGSSGNDTSYKWLHWNNLVVGTSDGRLLYTYADELLEHGVSRFRLAPWERLPVSAEQVVIIPNNNAMTAYTIEEKGTILYPVVCAYTSQPSKVFLVRDPIEGVKKLESRDLQDTITGGRVRACAFIPWQSSQLQQFTLPTT